jgi:CheY-like chemotaxis protein
MREETPKQKILIVDDVPANIKILQLTLMPDYDICVSTDGAEALQLANANLPDLILLDIMMPGMDGYEVCRRLKSAPRTRHVPVIFITARNQEEEETKGFDLGAVDYITKPFSPAIVKSRVNTHLDLKRHRDYLEELNRLLKQEIAERRRSEKAMRYLLKKQEINIEMAKKILRLLNGIPPRYIDLPENLCLFVEVLSIPCYAEGGDHHFVRVLPPGKYSKYGKTVISLKDQSGHEVSCILRSIITDLIHNAILNYNNFISMESALYRLNDEICYSQVFDKEDFFTSVNAEIDHETFKIRYASAGHPPFLLIRGNEVTILPASGGEGANIPIAVKKGTKYSIGEYQLREGDKVIFYTDGLTEMPLKNLGKMIAPDRLKQVVEQMIGSENHRHPTVSDIMNNLLNHIAKMSGEDVLPQTCKLKAKNTSEDDITLLCLEIENRNRYNESFWKPQNSEELAEIINQLYGELESQWHEQGYASPERSLRIVLEEAMLNAWIHGNHRNPEKSLTVRWRFGNDFHLEVIDEGAGFDYHAVPDPTSANNLTKPSGRGIFIIRYFSSHMKWKKGGRHLIVSFKKYPDSGEQIHIRRMEKWMRLWRNEN